ncbi:MAG: YjbH domain-containing protein, partial [Planctomycetota bacterium]
GVRLGASYNYGDRLGLQVTLPLNPKRSAAGPGSETAPLPVLVRAPGAAEDLGWTAEPNAPSIAQATVTEALAQQGIVLEAMALDTTQVEVRISNSRYNIGSQVIGRVARTLTRTMPASVETFVITPVRTGVPSAKVTFQRSDLEALEHAPSSAILERAVFSDAAGPRPANLQNSPGQYPRFTFGIAPYIDKSYFDPDSPYRAELGLALSATYRPAPGLEFAGTVKGEIVGNIDEITREGNSRLEPVRTNFAEYSRASDIYLNDLTAAYFMRPGRNLYGRVSAGYLERMFGGVSGELLWKPVDSRLALGAELNYARQRDFDGQFGFQDYDVWTGHASV